MARKRQIDPGIWTNEQFTILSDKARLLFIGMISQADDEGRLKGGSGYLKMVIFPADNITNKSIETYKQEIVNARLITCYYCDNQEYIYLPSFTKHQYMTKKFKSTIPEPPIGNGTDNDNGTGTIYGVLDNQLITDTQQVNNKLITDKKQSYGEFKNVKLSEEEHQKLIDKFGDKTTFDWIEKLSSWLKSNGKSKKDHYATILSWDRRDGNKDARFPAKYPKPDEL